jgi:hypothetical protein
MSDWRLIFLENHLELVDRELARLYEVAKDHPDPDGAGLLDDLETLSAIGFLFCQRFIVGAAKSNGLKVQVAARRHSPLLQCGLTAVELVCAGANLWKHEDEWPEDPVQTAGPWSVTVTALQKAGVWSADYKISQLLGIVTSESDPSFIVLHRALTRWSDALNGSNPSDK